MENLKNPRSVLVVVHADETILLLERLEKGFWQSVTGSLEKNETIFQCAQREVFEETGIRAPLHHFHFWRQKNRYAIFDCFRHRYAPDVFENTEFVLSLKVEKNIPVVLNPAEHVQFQWLAWPQAGQKVFSPSNRNAIMYLGKYGVPFV